MARKRKIACQVGERRFTVVVVGSDPYDSHAAKSFQRALELAMPDRGSRLTVWSVCASEAGSARLPSTYKKRGYVTQRKRHKRGG